MHCNHGYVIPASGHAVHIFMNSFEEAMLSGAMLEHITKTFQQHREVWQDATMRDMAISIISSIGTNFILEDIDQIETARGVAMGIILLEHHDGEGDDLCSAAIGGAAALRDLAGGGARDVIRFYSKRISCSCLNEKYITAKKSQPKIGTCCYCDQEKERRVLMLFS